VLSYPPLWIFVVNILNLCIAFRSRFGYDVEQEDSSQELMGVNIREAQESYLSPVLKQRQASVHTTPFKIFFTIVITI
jgi:hypothetical protein